MIEYHGENNTCQVVGALTMVVWIVLVQCTVLKRECSMNDKGYYSYSPSGDARMACKDIFRNVEHMFSYPGYVTFANNVL